MSHKGVVRLLKSALPMIMLVMQIGMPIKVHDNQLVPDPGETGPCTVEKMHLEYDGLGLDFFSPVDGTCSSWSNAPYPGLVFAHGFSMMGLTDGVADLSGYGEHLASWGYWLALPALPDDAETRISDLRKVLDRLLLESNQISSPIYKKIDPDRIAASGYSLGGATALAAAARDERITAVVALDPVYHEGGFQGEGEPIWNPEIEGKDILIPTGIIGSPPSECNAQADYEDIFSYLGAQHAAAYLLVGASHCDFLDPGNSYCPIFCSGTLSPARTKMSQRYLTAWLNYYLMLRRSAWEL